MVCRLRKLLKNFRPGTSFYRPKTNGLNSIARPVTSQGKSVLGYIRPATQGRSGTRGATAREGRAGLSTARSTHTAMQRVQTAKSSLGTRIGAASRAGNVLIPGSLSQLGGSDDIFSINFEMLVSSQPLIAKSLFEYIFYFLSHIQRALELASAALASPKCTDWWWKLQAGKCYYRLGLWKEAEEYFNSSLKMEPMPITVLHMCKVLARLDQPEKIFGALCNITQFKPPTTLTSLFQGKETFSAAFNGCFNKELFLQMARILQELGLEDESVAVYKHVVTRLDAGCLESLAQMASYYFYHDQPEVSVRHYKRMLQCSGSAALSKNADTGGKAMLSRSPTLWNNFALACLHAQQWDFTVKCLLQALALCNDDGIVDDELESEIWYNLGFLMLSVYDAVAAQRCWTVAVAKCPMHCEAANNLAALKLSVEPHNQNTDTALILLLGKALANSDQHLYEPLYNLALHSYGAQEFEQSIWSLEKVLKVIPGLPEALNLSDRLWSDLTV